MAEEKVVTPQGYTENPDLMPVPASQRAKGYSLYTWTFLMFSMNTCIPMFFLGPIGGGLGLDIYQALVGAFLGNLAAIVVMYLNGSVGVKYAVPYPVQLRESFGFHGIHIPVIVRGVAGTMWFGIEVWAGSYALTLIALWALGVQNATTVVFTWMVPAVIVYLALLVVVMRGGLKGIGRMADWAGPLMILYFVWLALFLSTGQFASQVPALFVSTAAYLSIPFFLYLAVQTNWWATVALNISDLSRGMKPNKSGAFFWGLMIGVVLCQVLGTALGYAVTTLTSTTLPQDTILKYAGAGLGGLGVVAIFVGLLFAFLAPWSTDITANVPPLIDILMATIKLRWKTAVLVAAVIGFIVCPWWAVSAGSQYTGYIQTWAGNYGILLGPIAGIMIGSYWINRKQTLDVQKLYTKGSGGYWFKGGWSRAAYLSWVCTIIVCYIIAILCNIATGVAPLASSFLAYIGAFPFPGSITWYFAVLFGFIFQALFGKMLKE